MKVWIVTADTYDEPYGAEIELFGVFDTEEKAIDCARKVTRRKKIASCNVTRVKMNKDTEKYLGGYYK